MWSDLSWKFETSKTVALKKDLFTRQMAMKIFECLENPVKYQMLNKRFYDGIQPHWFSQIKSKFLQTRLTEQIGLSHNVLEVLEFPTVNYIESLLTLDKKNLRMTGASKSTDINRRFNILLSTGE